MLDRKPQESWILEDDGTLDTVISCKECGKVERFSEAERDETGCITDAGWEQLTADAEADHDCAEEQ